MHTYIYKHTHTHFTHTHLTTWCWCYSKSFTNNSFNLRNKLGIIFVPILQMKEWRPREAKEISQSFLTKWQRRYSTWDNLGLDEENLAQFLVCIRHTTNVHSLAFGVHNKFLVVKLDGGSRWPTIPVAWAWVSQDMGLFITKTGTVPGKPRQFLTLESRNIHLALFLPVFVSKTN